MISQRTKEALADKRAAGVILGRPKGSSVKRKAVFDDSKRIDRLMAEGISMVQLSKQYGVHRNTLSKYLKEIEAESRNI